MLMLKYEKYWTLWGLNMECIIGHGIFQRVLFLATNGGCKTAAEIASRSASRKVTGVKMMHDRGCS
jgi:hypothetical protein